MDAKKSRFIRIILLVLILATGLYWYAPNPWEDRLCYNIPTVATERFVVSVWPPPDSEMGLGCFRAIGRDIELTIGVLATDVYPAPVIMSASDDVVNRTQVYVNGFPTFITRIEVPLLLYNYLNEKGEKVYLNGPGAYILHPFILIGRGKHTVVVKTTNNVGQKLEYQWSFTIK